MAKHHHSNLLIGFVYRGPHHVHSAWAESVGARFISNWLVWNYKKISSCLVPVVFLGRLLTLPAFDIYLCEDGYSLVLVYLRSLLLPKTKIAIIAASPFYYQLQFMTGLKKTIFSKIMRRVNCVFAVSDQIASGLKDLIVSSIVVVNPYVDNSRFERSVDIDSLSLCFVGRVSKQKGVETLLETFRLIKKEVPDSQFFLCGPWENNLVIDSKKHTGCYFTKSYCDPREYFGKSLIYIYLPEYDPFSVSVLEAMSSGLIPIVSATTGTAEAVEKVSENLVVPARNPIETSKRIAKILKMTRDEKRELSNRAIRVSKEYSKEQSVRQFRSYFKSINILS